MPPGRRESFNLTVSTLTREFSLDWTPVTVSILNKTKYVIYLNIGTVAIPDRAGFTDIIPAFASYTGDPLGGHEFAIFIDIAGDPSPVFALPVTVTFSTGQASAVAPLSLGAIAGVTPPLTNLVQWLDAGVGTWKDSALTIPAVLDGDPVGGWVEQTGLGKNALQATAGLRLTLKTGANGIGNRPALLSDRVTGQYLDTVAFAVALAQPNTIYACWKASSTPANAAFYDGGAASPGNRNLARIAALNQYSMYAGLIINEVGATANTDAHVDCCIFNGAGSFRYIDNVQKINGDAGANSLGALTVLDTTGGGANGISGLMAEILIYNVLHSAAQRATVQLYLANKYSITLS